MKATEQYFPVVLFIMLYTVVLTFESVGEIPKCDHLSESYWAVLSCGTVYYAVQDVVLTFESLGESYWAVLFCNVFVCALQDGSGFRVLRENPWVWPLIWKLPNSTFVWYCKVYT